MTKNTKIALGIGAAIVLYLILKPKKAAAATTAGTTPEPVIDPQPPVPTNPVTEPIPVEQANPSPPNPSGLTDQVKATVEPQTKPCEVTHWSCYGNNTVETIQIAYDDNCNNHQLAMPNCAPMGGGGGDMFMTAPVLSVLSNFA